MRTNNPIPTNEPTMASLIVGVQEWSIKRGIHLADSKGQYLKVMEEAGEIGAAMARSELDEIKDGIGDTVITLIIFAQQNGFEPEFEFIDHELTLDKISVYGQIVTHCAKLIAAIPSMVEITVREAMRNLNELAKQYGWTLAECLAVAYDEISGRTGQTVNGVFIKDEDLTECETDFVRIVNDPELGQILITIDEDEDVPVVTIAFNLKGKTGVCKSTLTFTDTEAAVETFRTLNPAPMVERVVKEFGGMFQ